MMDFCKAEPLSIRPYQCGCRLYRFGTVSTEGCNLDLYCNVKDIRNAILPTLCKKGLYAQDHFWVYHTFPRTGYLRWLSTV